MPSETFASNSQLSDSTKPLHIGIVAGEASGDILGADLIRVLKKEYPQIRFSGIGGPLMLAEGFETLFPMDRLSVMGLVEPLKRLPELLRIKRDLQAHFVASQPDVFLGIDSPDFNLRLAKSLKKAGLRTAHYVSPSVWAWRQGRVKAIARDIDLMLTLFPFEAKFYESHQVPVKFVGHPLADIIPLQPDQMAARHESGLPAENPIVAILPGSRGSEVAKMAEDFLQSARWCLKQNPKLHFVIPAANADRKQQIAALLEDFQDLPITLLDGQSRVAMTAADVVLIASGTTTLEAMLLKKPMVVAYRVAPLTFWIASRLVSIDKVGLPNLLAEEFVVPEVLQDAINPETLGKLVMEWFENNDKRVALTERFTRLHETMRCGASEQAAKALLGLISR